MEFDGTINEDEPNYADWKAPCTNVSPVPRVVLQREPMDPPVRFTSGKIRISVRMKGFEIAMPEPVDAQIAAAIIKDDEGHLSVATQVGGLRLRPVNHVPYALSLLQEAVLELAERRVDAALDRLLVIVRGRRDMNRRTAHAHPDDIPCVRAGVRADAYELDVMEIEALRASVRRVTDRPPYEPAAAAKRRLASIDPQNVYRDALFDGKTVEQRFAEALRDAYDAGRFGL